MGLCAFWGVGTQRGITGPHHQPLYQQCPEVPVSQLHGQHVFSFSRIAVSMNGPCRLIAPPLGVLIQLICLISTITMATVSLIPEVVWPELCWEPKQSWRHLGHSLGPLHTSLFWSGILSWCWRQRSLCSSHKCMLGDQIIIVLKWSWNPLLTRSLSGSTYWLAGAFCICWTVSFLSSPPLDSAHSEHSTGSLSLETNWVPGRQVTGNK